MTALDQRGNTAGHTGADSVGYAAHLCRPGLVVAGNMLSGPAVLEAMLAAYDQPAPSAAERMLSVLAAATQAGGDARGLLSAALLVLQPDRPPLDLRIDCDDRPIEALRALCARAHQPPYHDWLAEVPVLTDRHRAPGD